MFSYIYHLFLWKTCDIFLLIYKNFTFCWATAMCYLCNIRSYKEWNTYFFAREKFSHNFLNIVIFIVCPIFSIKKNDIVKDTSNFKFNFFLQDLPTHRVVLFHKPKFFNPTLYGEEVVLQLNLYKTDMVKSGHLSEADLGMIF